VKISKWLACLFIISYGFFVSTLIASDSYKIKDLHRTSKYRQKYDSLVDQICLMIKEDTNYLDLLSQLVLIGKPFAEEMGLKDPNLFLVERRNEAIRSGIKWDLDSYFQEKLDLLIKGQQPLSSLNGLIFPDGKFYKISPKNTLFPSFNLLAIVHVPNQIPYSEGHVLNFFGEGFENTTIFFSAPKDLNKMQNYLFCKWEELIEHSLEKEFMSEVAVFHWYFVQVNPFVRGSYFAANLLVDALLKSKGVALKIDPYRQMEFEILLEPYLKEFVRKYETYFVTGSA